MVTMKEPTTIRTSRLINVARMLTAAAALVLPVVPSIAAVKLTVDNSHPVLVDQTKGTAYLKIVISGEPDPAKNDRRPVNLALVLDRSGSMTGEKIAHAKDAAKRVVDRLADGDIVSIVTYESTVSVLTPAVEINDATRTMVHSMIDTIQADGSTALFAGVSKGAAEVRKSLSPRRVNRVILLSDGLANVGPQSPAELAKLGSSLGGEGITVTTVGLGNGYNEDLMTQLAYNSDGSHSFILEAAELATAFDRELDTMFSVVAQKIDVTIKLEDGIVPVRTLGRDCEIIGNQVTTKLNQLGENQQKYILLEVDVPEGASGKIASTTVRYESVRDGALHQLDGEAQVKRVADESVANAAVRQDVIGDAVTQKVVLANERAMELRDKGEIQAGIDLLNASADEAEGYMHMNAANLTPGQMEKLEVVITGNRIDAPTFNDESTYRDNRKSMQARQMLEKSQNPAVITPVNQPDDEVPKQQQSKPMPSVKQSKDDQPSK